MELSKWNPFKFVRRHSREHGGAASSGQRQQQQDAAGGSQQMGGMPAAWNDRGGLPDPLRMVASMMRDPFGSIGQLDRWFGDFSPAAFDPRIDVVDDGDAIRVVAELPGIDRNDVEIVLDDGYLVLRGEKRLEKKDEGEGAYRVERAFGVFERVIPLPEGVDIERAEAKFDNGTLSIRLPKAAGARKEGRRLEIGGPGASASSSGSPPGGTAPGKQQG
ncbi:MAG: Hsp20/alpha crystallin family protein [Usitatibacter sp.]